VTKSDGKWQCAEVVAEKSLGYGEYRWVFSGDLSVLDRRVVLGLFTYENTTKEIDFELSRWGDVRKGNAQFVVQPYTAKDSTYRFDTGRAKVLTVSLLWEKDQPAAAAGRARIPTEHPWQTGNTQVGTSPPGKERARANLWLFEGKPPPRVRSRK
jgi:hypothetical protein